MISEYIVVKIILLIVAVKSAYFRIQVVPSISHFLWIRFCIHICTTDRYLSTWRSCRIYSGWDPNIHWYLRRKIHHHYYLKHWTKNRILETHEVIRLDQIGWNICISFITKKVWLTYFYISYHLYRNRTPHHNHYCRCRSHVCRYT